MGAGGTYLPSIRLQLRKRCDDSTKVLSTYHNTRGPTSILLTEGCIGSGHALLQEAFALGRSAIIISIHPFSRRSVNTQITRRRQMNACCIQKRTLRGESGQGIHHWRRRSLAAIGSYRASHPTFLSTRAPDWFKTTLTTPLAPRRVESPFCFVRRRQIPR